MLSCQQMNVTAKLGLASLVAIVLFFNPIGFCADVLKDHSSAAHPCCPAKPASLPDDCARPGCIYVDTSLVPVAAGAATDAGPVCEFAPILVSMETQPAATPALAHPLAPLPPFQRFVVFHQFLI